MRTYLQVHVYYNVPPLILLYLLHRPLATNHDLRKYAFLCIIAVLYTTPWDNWIIYRKAWTYCPTCVMGTIGLVPVEEYMFFVVQTLLTCQFHSLLTKTLAGLPSLSISPRKRTPFLSVGLCAAWLAIGAAAVSFADPGRKTFYLAAIVAWTAPVLCFLFTLSAVLTSFLPKRWLPSLLAVLIPTLYLWCIDSIAIRAGTWHITERTSLEIFLWDGLPIEEAVFFLLTNVMVVLGCTGFDLASAIVSTYENTKTRSFPALCQSLLKPRNDQVVQDLQACVHVLQQGSASFYNSSFFFDEDLRRDLIVLYAFCRLTDDSADNVSEPVTSRKAKLDEARVFVQTEFASRPTLSEARSKSEKAIQFYGSPIYRSMLRFVAARVPQEPLLELLDGYEWDLLLDLDVGKEISTDNDVIRYSNHVASSVAEMCVYLIDENPSSDVLSAAREMGVVLQLTNIARDILTDAISGRVYLPSNWLTKQERQALLQVAAAGVQTKIEEEPRIAELHLEEHALRLLAIADSLYAKSTGEIDALPLQVQRGLRIVTDGYYAIGRKLRSICEQGRYPRRAKLSNPARFYITMRHLYAPTTEETLIFGGCAMRLLLLLYGAWQDSLGGHVGYTDIDYKVFSDAAAFVQHGGSPYERATYRYTPLLAWLLVPNEYFAPFGKCLFAAGDILTGWLLIKLLHRRQQKIWFAAIWLLNPMVAVISTRGNCEGLLGAMAIGLVYAVERGRHVVAGLILGCAVHFKVYPILYAPSILWHLETSGNATTVVGRLHGFANRKRVSFAIASAASFVALSAGMFAMYGWPFIEHTFAYHISRSDHRHNFSVYHPFIYLTAQSPKESGVPWALLAFLPQLVLSMVVLPIRFSKRDLAGTFFVQTFCFVAFNKVVTSQYFMWYLVFLPLVLPGSRLLSWRKGGIMLICWIAAQAAWLAAAFQFEMKGKATFEEMAISAGLFFVVNIWILGEACRDMA